MANTIDARGLACPQPVVIVASGERMGRGDDELGRLLAS